MAGMLLKGGAQALVGTGLGGQPPITQSPPAATSASSVSEVAFGPNSTAVRSAGAKGAWLTPGPHQVVMAGIVGFAFLAWVYHRLPQ